MILGIFVSAIIANDIMSRFADICIAAGGVRFIEGITTVGAAHRMSVIAVAVVFGRLPTFNGITAIVAFYYVIFGSGGVHIEIVAGVFGIIAVGAVYAVIRRIYRGNGEFTVAFVGVGTGFKHAVHSFFCSTYKSVSA